MSNFNVNWITGGLQALMGLLSLLGIGGVQQDKAAGFNSILSGLSIATGGSHADGHIAVGAQPPMAFSLTSVDGTGAD